MKKIFRLFVLLLSLSFIIGIGTRSEAKSVVSLPKENIKLYTSSGSNTATIKLKATKNVKIKSVRYKSSNKKIRVSQNGVVTALKTGKSSVKVIVKYTYKGKNKKTTLKCTIHVMRKPIIRLNKRTVTLKPGEAATITLLNAKNKHIKFYCEDSSVFTFESAKANSVIIVGVEIGKSNLVITCDNIDYICRVTVVE